MANHAVRISLDKDHLGNRKYRHTLYAVDPHSAGKDTVATLNKGNNTREVGTYYPLKENAAGLTGEFDVADYYLQDDMATYIQADDSGWRIEGTYHGDTIISGAGNDYIKAGNPSVLCAEGPASVYDTDYIDGGAGNDYIDASYFNGGTIHGGLGDDTIKIGDDCSINGPKDRVAPDIVVFEENNGHDIVCTDNFYELRGGTLTLQWEASTYGGIGIGWTRPSTDSQNVYHYLNVYDAKGNSMAIGMNNGYEKRDLKVRTPNGQLIAKAYLGGYWGKNLNYSGQNCYLVCLGDQMDDTIIAGNGGSDIWGGGGDDTIWGGAGHDTFYYGGSTKYPEGELDGALTIYNGGAEDKVCVFAPMHLHSFKMKGNDLYIEGVNLVPDNVKQSITVKNWSENGLNTFQIWDGSTWGFHRNGNNVTCYRKG